MHACHACSWEASLSYKRPWTEKKKKLSQNVCITHNPGYRMPALAGSGNLHSSDRHNSFPPVKFNHPLGNIKVSRSDGQLRLDWNISDEVPAEVQFRRRTPTTNWTLVSLFPRSEVTFAPIMSPCWCLHPPSWGFCLRLALMVISLLPPSPPSGTPSPPRGSCRHRHHRFFEKLGLLFAAGSLQSSLSLPRGWSSPVALSAPPTPASPSSMTTSCFLRIIFSFAPSLSLSPAHFSATAAPCLPHFCDPTQASVFPSYKREMGQESWAAPPFTSVLRRCWREGAQAAQ